MDDKTSKLFVKVTNDRLERALESREVNDESKTAFKEAMEAVDRQIEMSKLETSKEERLREEVAKSKEARWGRALKIVEIGAVTIGGPLIGYAINSDYIKKICNFEKDYTFTTSPGRGLSSLFRFKK